ncbi:MAG: oligosaccharide flippase family protein [Lachnospiraceae bacterium]|nr:oligosaccharide flippase family protein [Lachnospiraceae bacterium]
MMNNRLLKSSFWFVVTSVILNGINIFTAPIFTNLLSTSEYGQISNFNTWSSIFSAVLGMGLSYTITNAEVDFNHRLNEYIGNIIVFLLLVISCLCIILLFFFEEMIAEITELGCEMMWLSILYTFFYSIYGIVQFRYIFEQKILKNAIVSIVPVLASVVLSIVFIVYFPFPKSFGRVLGNCIPTFVVGCIFAVYYMMKAKWSSFSEDLKYALNISLPMVPHGLAIIVLGQIDRIMIIKIFGDSEAGVYSFGYTLGMLVSIVSIAINKAFQPWVFEEYKKENYDIVRKTGRKMVFLVFVGIIVYCMVAPEVLHILADKKFWASAGVIYPVAVSAFCQYIYGLYTNIEQYYKKTMYIAIGTITASVINVVLNYLLMPIYGYQVAAITTLIGYFVLMVYHYCACRIITQRETYNFIFEIILFFVLVCFAIASYLLFDAIILRWIIAVVLMGFIGYLVLQNYIKKVRTGERLG